MRHETGTTPPSTQGIFLPLPGKSRCVPRTPHRATPIGGGEREALRISVGAGLVAFLGERRRKNAEILRLRALSVQQAAGGQPPTQQFPYGGRPAGHALIEAPVVEGGQLFLGQHDLQPFRPLELCHSVLPPGRTARAKMSNQRRFGLMSF